MGQVKRVEMKEAVGLMEGPGPADSRQVCRLHREIGHGVK